MSIFPLISIIVLYFSIALLKPTLQKFSKTNICAICLAVAITWLIMIPLFLLGRIDGTSLAILMGMSLTGIMYKLELLFKSKKIRNFWFARIVIVLGGYYLVSAFLSKEWNFAILLSILVPLGVFMSGIFFQGTSHGDAIKEIKGSKKSIIKKLEDCC